MTTHTINQRLLHGRVSVHLVGCGGNGMSQCLRWGILEACT
jgi:hypothetical protein